jgi:hypothetical protein
VGAARELQRLQDLGVTHVVNASPIVPCFHRKALHYQTVDIYDDGDDDIKEHLQKTSVYISKVPPSSSSRDIFFFSVCKIFLCTFSCILCKRAFAGCAGYQEGGVSLSALLCWPKPQFSTCHGSSDTK